MNRLLVGPGNLALKTYIKNQEFRNFTKQNIATISKF